MRSFSISFSNVRLFIPFTLVLLPPDIINDVVSTEKLPLHAVKRQTRSPSSHLAISANNPTRPIPEQRFKHFLNETLPPAHYASLQKGVFCLFSPAEHSNSKADGTALPLVLPRSHDASYERATSSAAALSWFPKSDSTGSSPAPSSPSSQRRQKSPVSCNMKFGTRPCLRRHALCSTL
jgi:hypothetical protein